MCLANVVWSTKFRFIHKGEKKVDASDGHCSRICVWFFRMSRLGGMGARWFDRVCGVLAGMVLRGWDRGADGAAPSLSAVTKFGLFDLFF
jgi:hypothetical protein